MGRQYLGGRTPVLPDSHDNLGSLIDQLEGMIELYNVDVRASLLLRRIGMASESKYHRRDHRSRERAWLTSLFHKYRTYL